MKWSEGKYERRWRHSDNWWAWYDLLGFVALVACIAVIVVCIGALLFILMNPRVATSGDNINDTVVMRLRYSCPLAQDSLADVSVTVKPGTHPVPAEISVSRSEKPVKILYMEVSAYSPTVAECDGNPLRTASGKTVYVGGIAADLRILPFGSIVIIPNYNGGKPCTVIDTGGAIRGNKLDVFLWSAHEAIHWGRRRNVRVEILYIPKGES